jgi:chromosome segregation ATPase
VYAKRIEEHVHREKSLASEISDLLALLGDAGVARRGAESQLAHTKRKRRESEEALALAEERIRSLEKQLETSVTMHHEAEKAIQRVHSELERLYAQSAGQDAAIATLQGMIRDERITASALVDMCAKAQTKLRNAGIP